MKSINLFGKYDIDTFKQKLSDLIQFNNQDNIKNHFRNIYLSKDETFQGEIKHDSFSLWFYDSRWTGILYSVISGKIINRDLKVEVKMDFRINPIGKLVFWFNIIVCSIWMLFSVIIQVDNSLVFLIRRILLAIFVIAMFQIPFYIIYWNARRELIEDLKDKLQLNKDNL